MTKPLTFSLAAVAKVKWLASGSNWVEVLAPAKAEVSLSTGQNTWIGPTAERTLDKNVAFKFTGLDPCSAYEVKALLEDATPYNFLVCTKINKITFGETLKGTGVWVRWWPIDTDSLGEISKDLLFKYTVHVCTDQETQLFCEFPAGSRTKIQIDEASLTLPAALEEIGLAKCSFSVSLVFRPKANSRFATQFQNMSTPLSVASEPVSFISAPRLPKRVLGVPSAVKLLFPSAMIDRANQVDRMTPSQGHITLSVWNDLSMSNINVPIGVGEAVKSAKKHFKVGDFGNEISIKKLKPHRWYWMQLDLEIPGQPTTKSDLLSVKTSSTNPAPPRKPHAAFTVFTDRKRLMRHVFVKLSWSPPRSSEPDVDFYLILRADNVHEWEVVHRTTDCACVLSALVTNNAFDYECTFIVRACNEFGLAECKPFRTRILGEKDTFQHTDTQTQHISSSQNAQNKTLQKTRQLVRNYLDSDLVISSEAQNPKKRKKKKKKRSPDLAINTADESQQLSTPNAPANLPRTPESAKGNRPESPRKRFTIRANATVQSEPDDNKSRPPTSTGKRCSITPRDVQKSMFGDHRKASGGTSKSTPYTTSHVNSFKKLEKQQRRSISKAVYKTLGLPDLTRHKGVRLELHLRDQLKSGNLLWTFGYAGDTQNFQDEGSVNPKLLHAGPLKELVFSKSCADERLKLHREKSNYLSHIGSSKAKLNTLQNMGNSSLSRRQFSTLVNIDFAPNLQLLNDAMRSVKLNQRSKPTMGRTEAATRIQATFRMFRVAGSYSDIKSSKVPACVTLQSFSRMVLAKRKVSKAKEEHKAAALIQRISRGSGVRKSMRRSSDPGRLSGTQGQLIVGPRRMSCGAQVRQADQSAKRMQACMRGHLSRKKNKSKLEAYKKKRSAAVCKIQAKIRANNDRVDIAKTRSAIAKIQSKFREHDKIRKEKFEAQARIMFCVIRLQTNFRAYHARKQLDHRKRLEVKSVVCVSVSRAGHSKANGNYETMGVSMDAGRFVYMCEKSGDSYVIERDSDPTTNVALWVLRQISSDGESKVLYANKVEGSSLRPPRRSWQAASGPTPVPVLSWKSSLTYVNAMNAMKREAVVVTDSGVEAIHGRYEQIGVSDGVSQYVYTSATRTYALLRTCYGDTKIWLIVGTLIPEAKSASKEEDIGTSIESGSSPEAEKQVYYVNLEKGKSASPPKNGWVVAQHGVEPVPLFVKQQKLEDDDE